ncbi:S41 family peptidase [Hanstruepera marina]|uniref:S41 family peptidase n=1 Tax=Hanstruepera marina TaxID=2873265 RepID=UPI001CA70F40|nr:S41 family peptidase [Hanstruepera marina]
MRLYYSISVLLLAFLLQVRLSFAQDSALSNSYKQDVIAKLSELMNDYYVFPDVAQATETHLKNQLSAGHFDTYTTDEAFAAALTESVQSINKDKHMRIRTNPPYVAPDNSPERAIEEQLDRMNRTRWYNAGFVDVKVIPGNVGYLDLRGFSGLENGQAHADAAMQFISRADAIIIDLTQNGGGSPRMVQYLCSYFFDDHRHLNSLYWRDGDVTEEFWTLEQVNGTKLPDVPLFVMTSNRTFSGAEEFSYNMQTQKRATLVGQTTGGGANPGGTMPINENLNVFIPSGRAINPITQTNWEGVGVVPEVKTTPEDTYQTTLDLAVEAAKAYRAKRNAHFTQLLQDLNSQLEQYTAGSSETAIYKQLQVCQEANLMDEGGINNLGYTYLMEKGKPQIATCIFKANTLLYPDSPNVYDSYAESLMANGDKEASVSNYQKAVDLATSQAHPNLDLFKDNLQTAKKAMNTKN